jgi:hypothetical protein
MPPIRSVTITNRELIINDGLTNRVPQKIDYALIDPVTHDTDAKAEAVLTARAEEIADSNYKVFIHVFERLPVRTTVLICDNNAVRNIPDRWWEDN